MKKFKIVVVGLGYVGVSNAVLLAQHNEVIGVDLDYSEFSGGGKSMLFLVASGTAVTFKK